MFSRKTKNELARILPAKKCCQQGELAALICMNGTLTAGDSGLAVLVMTTGNAGVARKIYKLAKLLFQQQPRVRVQRKAQLRKNNVYTVELVPPFFFKGFPEEALPVWLSPLVARPCCRRAYLRGAYLGGGSVNNPKKNYHLEIVCRDPWQVGLLCRLMESFHLQPKVAKRKAQQVVYFKEGEQIADLLSVVGGHGAVLSFENTRVYKEVRNRVNRLVNCDTANLSKTVNAALRQVESIKLIQARMGLETLPPALRALAELRLTYPDSSLKELGQMLSPRVGKSGVNHRMRRLEEIAAECKRKVKTAGGEVF